MVRAGSCCWRRRPRRRHAAASVCTPKKLAFNRFRTSATTAASATLRLCLLVCHPLRRRRGPDEISQALGGTRLGQPPARQCRGRGRQMDRQTRRPIDHLMHRVDGIGALSSVVAVATLGTRSKFEDARRCGDQRLRQVGFRDAAFEINRPHRHVGADGNQAAAKIKPR